MRSLSQSIWFLLTHSIITLIAVLALLVVFVLFQIGLSMSDLEAQTTFRASLLINLTLGSFVGIYLGGALSKLKQNYLWRINRSYRSSLMVAYLIIIGGFNLLQVPFLFLNTTENFLLLLAPFCITIFSSQLILGKTIVHRYGIPAFPLAVAQLAQFGADPTSLMLLILLGASLLLSTMYHDRFYPDSLTTRLASMDSSVAQAATASGIRPAFVTSLNHYIGLGVASWIANSRKSVDWAVLMPHTKLALTAMFYIAMIMGFVLFSGAKDSGLVETFLVLFAATWLVGMIIECRPLIRQTRFFAQVFSANQHRQLKNKILFSLDKVLILNCAVILAGILSLSKMLSISVDPLFLIYAVVAIILVGLAIYPLLLCIRWIDISFYQVLSVCVYAALVYLAIHWLRVNSSNVLASPFALGFVLACLATRACTQMFFWRWPIESLFKNT